MADLALTLPESVEIGARRTLDYATEVVTTDGGYEVRNARWSSPLRMFEVSYPISLREGADHLAVKALYDASLGGLYSFRFKDWTDGSILDVRFDSPLEIESPASHLDHIVSLRLKEVRA
jgi:uncharacterized protein (TIGR02217 family)